MFLFYSIYKILASMLSHFELNYIAAIMTKTYLLIFSLK